MFFYAVDFVAERMFPLNVSRLQNRGMSKRLRPFFPGRLNLERTIITMGQNRNLKSFLGLGQKFLLMGKNSWVLRRN